MKTTICLWFVPLLLSVATVCAQPRKLALIVGIDRYQPATGKKSLRVCNGLPLLRQTLLAQGFSDSDIRVLADSQATHKAILRAIDDHLGQAGNGDIALFHFTGHGIQIPDDNGDERDNLDEALLPWDALPIRDDLLGQHLDALCRNIGPDGQVLALLDACHTGTGMRGSGGKAKKEAHSLYEGKAAPNEQAAPLIAFFSSRPNERSFQIKGDDTLPYGPLTYAFCTALQQAGPQTTYRGLFDRVNWQMLSRCPSNVPQAEGDLDRRLFGGLVQPPPRYVQTLAVINPRRARVKGGMLNGLRPGTEVALYPIDTGDTTETAPLAFGNIADYNAGLTECTVELDRPLAKDLFEQAWIFIRKHSFAGYDISVHLDIADPETTQSIRDHLVAMATVRLDGAVPELLISRPNPKQLLLRAADSTVLARIPYAQQNPEKALHALRERIYNFAQAQFLRGLNLESSLYHVEFTCATSALRVNKDIAVLHVTNRSATAIYYTVLDIDGANNLSVLLPDSNWPPTDFRLEPGQIRTHRVTFDTPGREVLKLIATPEPIDLRDAVATRGRGLRGHGFWENLFRDSFPDASPNRRGPTTRYRGDEAGIATMVLEVVK